MEISDRFVISRSGNPIGILNPSTLVQYCENKLERVYGPFGIVDLRPNVELLEALVASGSVLLGSETDIQAVAGLLSSPRWSRSVSYFCSISKRLDNVIGLVSSISKARIAILGCGGIGSLAAVMLAGMNARELFLVDSDHIEESNLNRQFFWTRDNVGSLKVAVLEQAIRARNSTVTVTRSSKKIELGELEPLIMGFDAALLCADEPIGLINEFQQLAVSGQAGTCVSAGYMFGSASVTLHGRTEHVPSRRLNGWQPLDGGIMPSYGPLNAEVAGRAVTVMVNSLAKHCIAHSMLDLCWRPNDLQE